MRYNSLIHTATNDCCGHENCEIECVCDSDWCPMCDTPHGCVCDAMTDAYREWDLDI